MILFFSIVLYYTVDNVLNFVYLFLFIILNILNEKDDDDTTPPPVKTQKVKVEEDGKKVTLTVYLDDPCKDDATIETEATSSSKSSSSSDDTAKEAEARMREKVTPKQFEGEPKGINPDREYTAMEECKCEELFYCPECDRDLCIWNECGDEFMMDVDSGELLSSWSGPVCYPVTNKFMRLVSYHWFYDVLKDEKSDITVDNIPACVVEKVRKVFNKEDDEDWSKVVERKKKAPSKHTKQFEVDG